MHSKSKAVPIQYTHTSPSAGTYFAVLQTRRVSPRIKSRRSIKIVRQLEQVFEPYLMLFRETKKQAARDHNISTKENKHYKTLKHFRFSRGSWNLNPTECEGSQHINSIINSEGTDTMIFACHSSKNNLL